jgi:hypothetical protein
MPTFLSTEAISQWRKYNYSDYLAKRIVLVTIFKAIGRVVYVNRSML